MPGPLEGVKVVEFTEIIAGPLAGMLLADLGAEVIKVEPPWGDPWRFVQPFSPTESRVFMAYNRGKRSLPLDLASPQSGEILKRLIADTDVVLVNYRPDVVAKLGVDYEKLSGINPRLIYCDLTAYGSQGPDAHRPGYDLVLQAISGMIAAENKIENGVPQQIWSGALIDTTSGFCLAWSVCAALFARERTGKGQRVESNLLGSTLTLLGMRLVQVESIDQATREQNLEDLSAMRGAGMSLQEMLSVYQAKHRRVGGNTYYQVYEVQDGGVAVACLSQPLRLRLLDVLGLTDIRFEPGFDENTPEGQAFEREFAAQAESIFRSKTVKEWLSILGDRGIPAGEVKFVEEMFDDPQVKAAGLIIEMEHQQAGTVKMVGPIASFSETPLGPSLASPALGQHTDEILAELGFEAAEIRGWHDNGLVR